MKYLLIIIGSALLTGCANMVSPTGGKKDDKIPQLIRTNLVKTNFNARYIQLEFDENIVVDNNPDKVSIQPKHTTYHFDNSNKIIKIKLDSNLKANTTYILDIEGGIKDLNEGNTYSLSYIFSTGETIDTNFISYKIKNINGQQNLKIGLTQQKVDSLFKLKFDYLYPIKNESITIGGLGSTIYNIWIFTDKNNDNIPDEFMPVYYDTTQINTSKSISLNQWINTGNQNEIAYRRHTKIFKPINDLNTYNLSQVIYIDKDSALFYNPNNDTFPTLDVKSELKKKISNKIKGIKNSKDYTIIIDKCGINNIQIADKLNYRENENYLYINSKLKIDSLNFKVMTLNDTFRFFIKNITYQPSNTVSTLKITKSADLNNVIMVAYLNNKIELIKKINMENDHIFYLNPGTYKFMFYKTGSYKKISFDFDKMEQISCPIIEKEIILKPNWDEVLQLNFN